MVQGELFHENRDDFQSKNIASFLSGHQWLIGLDKILLLTIALVVLFVLTYSFGYEKGRRAMESKIASLTAQMESFNQAPFVPETVLQGAGESLTAVTPGLITPELAPADAVGLSATESTLQATRSGTETSALPDGKYTIQVATLLKKDIAEKEKEKLSTKGFQSFYVSRGRYYEICVGGFDTVANAKLVLSKLQSQSYSDAFVRAIPKTQIA